MRARISVPQHFAGTLALCVIVVLLGAAAVPSTGLFAGQGSPDGGPSIPITAPAPSHPGAPHPDGSTLEAGDITPASPSIDTGQSITLSAGVSGGTAPYTIAWYVSADGTGTCPGDGGAVGSNSSTYSTGALSTGSGYFYCYNVTDSDSDFSVSAWDQVTVNSVLTAGPSAPASPAVDSGQSITLSSDVSGGTEPYAFEWESSADGAGGCPGDGVPVGTNSPSYSAGPLTATDVTDYYYCYEVTDSSAADGGAESATSAWDLVTANPVLTAGSVTPASPAIDSGQSIAMTANPSGGTTPYGYQWYSSPTSTGECSSGSGLGTSATQSASPTADTYYCYTVTDSAHSAVTEASGWDKVTVNAGLTAGSVTPGAPAIDTGQSITLTANPSGGTTPYTYQWYSSSSSSGACDSGTSLGTSVTQTASPTANKDYCYTVTDSGHSPSTQSSAWDKVTVNAAEAAGSATPLSPGIDYGETVTLTANPTGGTTPYSYQWYYSSSSAGACSAGTALGTGGTQGTGAEVTGPGTYYYCYVVTDDSLGAGGHETSSSAWDTVTVNSALTAPDTPSPAATAVDVNQALSVGGVVPTTGTSTYAWRWLASVNAGAFADTSQCATNSGTAASAGEPVTCSIAGGTLTAGDTYAFELKITDNASTPESKTSTASAAVPVHSAFTAPGAPTPSVTALDADQPLTVSGSIPSTGTPSYSWQWLISAGGGSYGDATQCGASASGSGASAGAKETCTIPGNTLSASSSYTFELKATDNATTPESKTSPASSTVTTSSALTAGTPTPTSPSIDEGQSITIVANPSGGSGSYRYAWYTGSSAAGCTGLSSPIAGATGSSYSASPTTLTYYCYTVTDSHSDAATSAADPVTVNPALTAPAGPIPSATALDRDQMLSVTGTIPLTGTSPFVWQWLISVNGGGYTAGTECTVNNGTDASGGSTETCVIVPGTLSAQDAYTFELNVGDSAATPASTTSPASASVAVAAALTAPAPPTPSVTSLEVSQPLTVTATIPSTGSPTYSWQWLVAVGGSTFGVTTQCATNSGAGASGGASETCSIGPMTLTAGETYTFELSVTDSASTPETNTSAASAPVTTTASLAAGSPSPVSPTIDLGQSVTLTANPSGGSGSYSYQWYSGNSASACLGLTSPVSGATASTYVASPPSTTYYCYVVTTTSEGDATGANASASSGWDLVTVNPGLTAPPVPTLSAQTVGIDQAITVTGTIPATGTPTYSWQWLISVNGGAFAVATQCAVNSGTGAAAGATETCAIAPMTLTAGDSYAFALAVTDSATTPFSQTSSATSALTVTLAAAGTTPSGSSWSWVYDGIVLAAIGAVGLVAVSGLRRRRPRPEGTVSESTDAAGPSAPPSLNAPTATLPTYAEPPAPIAPSPPAATFPEVQEGMPPPTPPAGRQRESWSEVESVLTELDEITAAMAKRTPKSDTGAPTGTANGETPVV